MLRCVFNLLNTHTGGALGSKPGIFSIIPFLQQCPSFSGRVFPELYSYYPWQYFNFIRFSLFINFNTQLWIVFSQTDVGREVSRRTKQEEINYQYMTAIN